MYVLNVEEYIILVVSYLIFLRGYIYVKNVGEKEDVKRKMTQNKFYCSECGRFISIQNKRRHKKRCGVSAQTRESIHNGRRNPRIRMGRKSLGKRVVEL